jgi:hypothetical protein
MSRRALWPCLPEADYLGPVGIGSLLGLLVTSRAESPAANSCVSMPLTADSDLTRAERSVTPNETQK